jgi:hypothetical protein
MEWITPGDLDISEHESLNSLRACIPSTSYLIQSLLESTQSLLTAVPFEAYEHFHDLALEVKSN